MRHGFLLMLLTATSVGAQTPADLSSVIIPPTSERTIVFTDRGRTYAVGTQSGKISILNDGGPGPVIPRPNPGTLSGLSKQVLDAVTQAVPDPTIRSLGARALIGAIESTIGEAGGLGTTDPQIIINSLAANAEAAKVNELLRGFRLGDILNGANVTTADQLFRVLNDIKAGMEAVK